MKRSASFCVIIIQIDKSMMPIKERLHSDMSLQCIMEVIGAMADS